MRYLVFIKADYVRDAQAYLGELSEDIFDDEHEENWRDINGPVLVLDGNFDSTIKMFDTIMKMYPTTDISIFEYIVLPDNK